MLGVCGVCVVLHGVRVLLMMCAVSVLLGVYNVAVS